MQSKFWAEGSESSSESYSDYSSQDDTDRRLQTTVPPPRWATIDSSSDEGTRRVVKSGRAKIRDTLNASIKILTQHSRIGDYVETLEDYDNLLKTVDKMCQDEPFPKIVLSAILDLQVLLEKILKDKESVKKFSRAKSIALNTLKSRLRKFNDSHQEDIERFRENPEITDSEVSSSESDSDVSSDTSKADEDEKVEESSDWSYSGSEKSEDEDKHKSALAKWGIRKKDDSISSKKKEKSGRKKEEKVEVKIQHKPSFQSGTDIYAALEGNELSESALRSYLKIIVGKRGRRGVDKAENTSLLQKLAERAKRISFPCYLEVLCHVIHSQFDSSADAFSSMNSGVWMEAFKNVEIVVHILNTEDDEVLKKGEMFEDNETISSPIITFTDKDTNPWVTLLTSFVQKLNDELCKSLLYTDLHCDTYKLMLSYSINMLYLLFRALSYTLNKVAMTHSATLALAILEHIHYKADGLDVKLWEMIKQKFNSPFEIALEVETRKFEPGIPDNLTEYFPNDITTLTAVVDTLVSFIFKEGSNLQKTRACLFWSYNKALHGDYYKAKELSCAINVQDITLQVDVPTQIYFNRNLAQLGLCAFSHGHINDAHSYLVDLCSQNRLKELLAQGLSSKSDKTPEQERSEKRRLFPYHMHLNLEVIECVNNICAMLIEIPNMTRPFMGNKEVVSRQFRRLFELYERLNYVGPAENSKETIIAASKALQMGDWKECFNNVESLNIWDKFPNEERVKTLLLLRIKKEALRTFIFR